MPALTRSDMASESIARHRTALRRPDLSRPIRLALQELLITNDTSVFDYGCGYGDDIDHLRERGIACDGWDPVHRPEGQRILADVVNLGYVVNVIENSEERAAVLRDAWALSRKVLVVSARNTFDSKQEKQIPFRDGWLTRSRTFQRYYEQHELRNWIDGVLGEPSVPAAPGIFYIFRDSDLRQSFLASRYRRRSATPRLRKTDILFEQHKTLLETLIEFVTSRGRLPDESELASASVICDKLGSVARAFSIVRRVTGQEQWDRIREERSQDLLIHLALAKFGGRTHFSNLPRDLRLDVRAFFVTYKRACALADEMLFSVGDLKNIESAMRNSPVGKSTANGFYVHASALPLLPSLLRIYEGCARVYIGAVDGANVIKLHRHEPQVSYLSYPDFERDPHPALSASLIVNLQALSVRYREYAGSSNPPILHRKEEFVPADHPLRTKFGRLTQQEERWGLYDEPTVIGTKHGWQKVLDDRGVRLSGHRVLRKRL
jgi:DNA phosphorothioation-associated putative methyltransferase